MHAWKIGASPEAEKHLSGMTGFQITDLAGEGVAAYVLTRGEAELLPPPGRVPVLWAEDYGEDLAEAISAAAFAYELSRLPPFTQTLFAHVREGLSYFATPGHHGGQFFRQTRAGELFYAMLGPGIFAADLSDSDSVMGDPSAHEGPAGEAEALAAQVYHAERTYFVPHGTSVSNRIVCAALLTRGDLVLFDRNNHKSLYQGAIEECGAIPVYLESLRNEGDIIGGLTAADFQEKRLRRKAEAAVPGQGKKKRPFRLACIQLATYDGVFANAAQILRDIGPLCDYILFDGAWAGYEHWVPFMRDQDVLAAELGPEAPGIIVTQSVHKQLAGFSQTSQIHRKDLHLAGKKRRVPKDVFQSAYLSHISTSPCFPLLASIEMNAAIHQERGRELWESARRFAVTLRKRVSRECRLIQPFQPGLAGGRPWVSYDTETLLRDKDFWAIRPGVDWHGLADVPQEGLLLDPCKILLCTKASRIPGAVLARYLEERRIVPEKSGFHTVLLLAEPGDGEEKIGRLMEAIHDFEEDFQKGRLLSEAMPVFTASAEERYSHFTMHGLCADIEKCMAETKVQERLTQVFAGENGPERAMNGRDGREAFVRGWREWVPLKNLPGRIALESAAAYPPGICTITAGEIWNQAAVRFYEAMTVMAERFPGLSPELQGLHERNGTYGAWVYRKQSTQ